MGFSFTLSLWAAGCSGRTLLRCRQWGGEGWWVGSPWAESHPMHMDFKHYPCPVSGLHRPPWSHLVSTCRVPLSQHARGHALLKAVGTGDY